MIKNITQKWLKENNVCEEALKAWFNEKDHGTIATLERLIKKNPAWANWLIARVMTRAQYIKCAIYAAEQTIKTFEDKHPDDKRPRQAIEAAKKCLKKNSKENRAAAYEAADMAAHAVADAAHAAAGRAVGMAVYAAAAAAGMAAYDATYAAEAMQIKILKYGMKLLRKENK